ncbi:Diaminopimelate epimerase-like protein [Thozetella sp. PMI_491]|nr:Diaminopimelate epimerase-like protein [Thozetella sp. PMI_491]
MKLNFTTLDAFTTTRYAGNPVAIVRVPSSDKASLTQSQKQAIASEFNLSEIVFLHLPIPGDSFKEVNIDIFTSKAEVPFAGHPTIGASQYLFNEMKETPEALITKAGRIPIELDTQTGESKAFIPQTFYIHGVTYSSPLTSTPARAASIVKGMTFVYAPLPDLATLAKATVNLHAEAYGDTYEPSPLDSGWQVGLVCTMYFVAQGEDEFGREQYRTRMFGTREDPGTGSASSGLGCYLALQEPKESGQGPFRYKFTQGVEMGRRNDIAVEVTRDEGGLRVEKVLLTGTAVKVMEGVLEV